MSNINLSEQIDIAKLITTARMRRAGWVDGALDEAWNRAQKILKDLQAVAKLQSYANRPVAFIQEVLGETLTPAQINVCESVCDNRVTIAKSGNAVGKSFIAARLAIWFFLTYPDSKIFLVAAPPLDNLRRILWGEIMNIVRTHADLFSPYKMRTLSMARYSQKNIDDPSFIAGLTIPTSGSATERQAKFSGKHAPHLFFIVDEGDAVPDEAYKGMESCMSGGHDRMLVMFNPRHQSGQMYHMERRGLAKIVPLSAFEHPNVVTGETIIPGAVDRQKVLTRINEWTRPLAADEKVNPNCYQVPDFLVGQTTQAPNGAMYEPLAPGWREVKEPEFWYMVLGEYPAQGELQLISREWINNARARWDLYVAEHGEVPPAGTQPIMGLDVSEFGSDANIACFRYGGFVARMHPWVGVDPQVTADKAVQLYLEKNCDIVMVDGTGVGSGVAPSMARAGWDMKPERDIRAVSVKVSERPSHLIKSDKGEFKILRDQLWWATREWLRTDNTAMLPPDEQLIDELLCPTYEIPFGKIMVMRKDEMRDMLKRSPNRADALCLTHAPFQRPTVCRLIE